MDALDTREGLVTRVWSVRAALSSFATLFSSASSLADIARSKSFLILASVEVGTIALCHRNHGWFDTVFAVCVSREVRPSQATSEPARTIQAKQFMRASQLCSSCFYLR